MSDQISFEAKVRDISGKGLGVVDHPDGRVVFVPGVWIGDTIMVQVNKMEKRYGFGTLAQVLEPSAARTSPPCSHHGFLDGNCGGCPWMFVDYLEQLAAKNRLIKSTLERNLGDSGDFTLHPIHGSPNHLGFRNRAQVKTDGKQIGFVSAGKKTLAPIKDCVILTEKNRQTLKALIQKLPNPDWKPKPKFLWSYLDFDEDISANEVAANVRRPFKQANDAQNLYMREWVKKKLSHISAKTPTVELFAGSGNFTQLLTEMGIQPILAADSSTEAIAILSAAQLEDVTAIELDLFHRLPVNKIEAWNPNPYLLFLDPPRGGFPMIGEFCKSFSSLGEILYISCDLHAFARDAKNLSAQGWQLKEVQPLDQFPHTPHIELLSWFTHPEVKNADCPSR